MFWFQTAKKPLDQNLNRRQMGAAGFSACALLTEVRWKTQFWQGLPLAFR